MQDDVQTVEPVLDDVQTDEPVLDDVHTEEPVLDDVQADEPVLDDVHTEEPVLDDVQTDDPVLNDVQTDEPVLDDVQTDEPVLDDVQTDEPVLDDVHTEEPVLDDPPADSNSSSNESSGNGVIRAAVTTKRKEVYTDSSDESVLEEVSDIQADVACYRHHLTRNVQPYFSVEQGATHSILVTEKLHHLFMIDSIHSMPHILNTSKGQILLYYNTFIITIIIN